MIYLMAKIFVYLVLALALGVAAGWLWRNLQATRSEAALQRRMLEAEARAAQQLEATTRTWEKRLERALGELNFREMELSEQNDALAEQNRKVAELQRACAELRDQVGTAASADAGEGERLQRALAAEQRRVEELTRERELQRRALAALEQQLELAREGRSRSISG